jgi:hypothetical protein
MENRNGTVVDRRGSDRVDYPLPGGGVMPVPRQIDDAGTNLVEGGGDQHSTQDTERPAR